MSLLFNLWADSHKSPDDFLPDREQRHKDDEKTLNEKFKGIWSAAGYDPPERDQ